MAIRYSAYPDVPLVIQVLVVQKARLVLQVRMVGTVGQAPVTLSKGRKIRSLLRKLKGASMGSRRLWKSVLALLVAVASVCTITSTAWAAPSLPPPPTTPGSGGVVASDPAHPNPDMDPQFLALKNAYRINSGVTRGQAKGTRSTPYVTATPMMPNAQVQPLSSSTYSWGYCTNCAELSVTTYMQHVWEPGDGAHPNFGYGTPSYDDGGSSYYDSNYFDLCGPGAADVALWYWPVPPNTANYYATDPRGGGQRYWKGIDPYDGVYRLRGYMVNLAWNIHAPGWPTNGMMQGGTATTDTKMRDALNWEASGENTSTWQNYFYVKAFPGPNGNTDLDNNVHEDVVYSNVPVVALLNAEAGLPNWPGGGTVGHFITIIGYNDDTGEYAYVDTCGYSTYCNHFGANSDGGIKKAPQSSVFNAIKAYGADWIW